MHLTGLTLSISLSLGRSLGLCLSWGVSLSVSGWHFCGCLGTLLSFVPSGSLCVLDCPLLSFLSLFVSAFISFFSFARPRVSVTHLGQGSRGVSLCASVKGCPWNEPIRLQSHLPLCHPAFQPHQHTHRHICFPKLMPAKCPGDFC